MCTNIDGSPHWRLIQPAPLCHLQVIGADVMGESSVASDPAQDMWAYGVIAYEILAGRRFFSADMSDQDVMQVGRVFLGVMRGGRCTLGCWGCWNRGVLKSSGLKRNRKHHVPV